MATETEIAEWIAEATELGRQAGISAASWIVDGNNSAEHIARMVAMIDDGDPELWDSYNPPNLSGEWAGAQLRPMLAPRALRSLARKITSDDDPDPDIMDDLATAWEDGVGETYSAECERILRAADTLPTEIESAEFLAGYLDSLAWVGCYFCGPDGGLLEQSGESTTVDPSDIHSDDVQSAKDDCHDFLSGNLADVREFAGIVGDWTGCDVRGYRTIPAMGCAGGDFYLSRCGHGAGYFARDAGKVGDRLQDAARVYGDVSVYMTDPYADDSEN